MKPLFPAILTAALLFLLITPAAAEVSLSFSDLDPLSNSEFWLYGYNQTSGEMSLLQRVSLNDSLSLQNDSSYIMVYRPTEISWFEDPYNAVHIMFLAIPRVILLGLFVAALLCIIYLFYRMSTGGGRR